MTPLKGFKYRTFDRQRCGRVPIGDVALMLKKKEAAN
jgi:hypothetical protein